MFAPALGGKLAETWESWPGPKPAVEIYALAVRLGLVPPPALSNVVDGVGTRGWSSASFLPIRDRPPGPKPVQRGAVLQLFGPGPWQSRRAGVARLQLPLRRRGAKAFAGLAQHGGDAAILVEVCTWRLLRGDGRARRRTMALAASAPGVGTKRAPGAGAPGRRRLLRGGPAAARTDPNLTRRRRGAHARALARERAPARGSEGRRRRRACVAIAKSAESMQDDEEEATHGRGSENFRPLMGGSSMFDGWGTSSGDPITADPGSLNNLRALRRREELAEDPATTYFDRSSACLPSAWARWCSRPALFRGRRRQDRWASRGVERTFSP